MNVPWALCLDPADATALSAIRLVDGIEIIEADGELWLRGRRCDEPLARSLRALPARARFEWLEQDRLRRIDQRIPAGQLPAGEWQLLAGYLQPEPPVAALPAALPNLVSLRLTRSTGEHDPNLLLTDIPTLQAYVQDAPEIRLQQWQFAASASGAAIVYGTPLPPLPGDRFVVHGRIAIPAGFHWAPAVSEEVLAQRFSVAEGTLILWRENGSLTRLTVEQFLPMTRSAVRATREAIGAKS